MLWTCSPVRRDSKATEQKAGPGPAESQTATRGRAAAWWSLVREVAAGLGSSRSAFTWPCQREKTSLASPDPGISHTCHTNTIVACIPVWLLTWTPAV